MSQDTTTGWDVLDTALRASSAVVGDQPAWAWGITGDQGLPTTRSRRPATSTPRWP